jgi:hypothetical protein
VVTDDAFDLGTRHSPGCTRRVGESYAGLTDGRA